MAARIKNKPPRPEGKISETFLDFAMPLLDLAGGLKASREEVEPVLKIAFAVWNAVVIDSVKGNDRLVTSIRRQAQGNPVTATFYEQLISRKHSEFAHDLRLIGNYELKGEKGNWRLWAEARDSSTLRTGDDRK
jgi:hypothetical protein